MDKSCCRERIERLLDGRTGMIAKVILKTADKIICLRHVVSKLKHDRDFFRALIV